MRLMHILDFFNVFGAVLKKFPSIEGLVFKAVLNNNTIGNHQNKPSEIVSRNNVCSLGDFCRNIPGLSRSGTTIAAGMATGLDRSFAVRFSFLMSLPAVLGANILSLAKAAKTGIDVSLLPAYLIGMFVAMVSGVAAIGLVKRLTSKGRFGAFSYYCWGAGALTMILSLIF